MSTSTAASCPCEQFLEICGANITSFPGAPAVDEVTTGMFWFYVSCYVVLALFSGLMSGLTLAILSLDVTSLMVMQKAGTEKNRKYATRILPLAQRHHMVLVALVLSNSLAVEGMPLVLDKIADVYVALAVSVTIILIVGEVIPQAVCSRYGLSIGYYCAWIVWVLGGLFIVVVYPLSLLLDAILGQGHGTLYRRAELQALVDIHGPTNEKEEKSDSTSASLWSVLTTRSVAKINTAQERLTGDEVQIIKAALEMKSKTASQAMTPLDEVFMLPVTASLDEKTLREIFEKGHSRIPIYDYPDRRKILKVLLVKKLILTDPKAARPIKQAMEGKDNRTFYEPFLVSDTMPLDNLLNEFQRGLTHIAFVTRINKETKEQEIYGIITLEQVIEQLLQEPILDEVDYVREVLKKNVQIARAATQRAAQPNDTPSPGKHTDASKQPTIKPKKVGRPNSNP